MSCEICGRLNGEHECRCPHYSGNYIGICDDVCNEPIYNGELYIENDNGRCIHYGCEKSIP